MRQPYMAICDRESGYAEHLTEYIRQKHDFPFRIGTFSEVDTLLEYTKYSKVDLVLLASEQYTEFTKKAKSKEYQKRCLMGQQTPIEHIILLDQGQKETDCNYLSIYKYQSVETILKELLQYLAREDVARQGKNESIRSKLITFYTPVHRCLQTTTALTYARLLAKKERVLFINLEAYSTLENLIGAEWQEDLADLLYASKESNDRFAFQMASMIRNEGNLDILPPMRNLEDLQAVTKEKWELFLKQLKEMHRYQSIVIDLGEPIRGFLDLMSASHRVIQLVREESSARQVLKQYERMIEMLDYPYLEEITERYCLPELSMLEASVSENPLISFIEENLMQEKINKSQGERGKPCVTNSIIWEEMAI